MPDYKLDLTIDPADLKYIKAAQLKITIAKPIGTSSPNVTWLVFDPFEGNTVEWKEEYSMYASTTPISTGGAVISKMSETSFPANDAAYYSFANNLFSSPHTGPGAPATGSYKVKNNVPNTLYPALTFGLQQKASISSKGINPSPINAALVPANLSATFTPFTTVYIWLQASFTSGTVITEVNGDAAIVKFGGSVTQKTLKYNPANGIFVPHADGKLLNYAEDSDVKLLKRSGVY